MPGQPFRDIFAEVDPRRDWYGQSAGRYGASMSPTEAQIRGDIWSQQNPQSLGQATGQAAFGPMLNAQMNFPGMMQNVASQYMGANTLNAGLAAARYQPQSQIDVARIEQQGQTERQESQLDTFGPLFQMALMQLLGQTAGGNTTGATVDGQRRQGLVPQQTQTAQYGVNPLLQQLPPIPQQG